MKIFSIGLLGILYLGGTNSGTEVIASQYRGIRLIGVGIMDSRYQDKTEQSRYQQFFETIHGIQVAPSQKIQAKMLKNTDEILPNLTTYPVDKKEALKSAIIAFRNRNGEFNKVLFNLLYQLRKLRESDMKLTFLYSASLEGWPIDSQGNKPQKPEFYETRFLEIEQLISDEKNEIFSSPEIATFNPLIFEGKFNLNELNPLQQHIAFMLLSCAKDETFTQFCKCVYGASIGPFRKELRDLGDKVSLEIEKIVPKAQDAHIHNIR